MTKNLFLDFFREIRRSANRFISILCIVAIGVALFTGLLSSAPDMEYTIDDYYDQYNIMDIQVLSTLGLNDDDIAEIEGLDVVDKVQPGYFTDALATIDGYEVAVRLHSMPTSHLTEGEECINDVNIIRGRLPENENELVIEDNLNYDYGFKVGDQITFYSGTDEALEDGTLKGTTFTIVGIAATPYYLTYSKGNSQIEGKSIELFAYISEDAFTIEDYYIEALITLKGAKELNAFDKDYEKLIEEAQNAISNIGADRVVIRADEIREQAYEELDKAQKEYDEGLAEFNEEISKAEEELDNAYTDLIKGEKELESQKAQYELEVEHAREEIADGEEELEDAAEQIASGKEQLASAQTQYNTALEQYNSTMESSAQYRETLKELENMMASINDQIESNPDADNSFLQSLYDDIQQEYNDLKALNSSIDESIVAVEELLAETEQSLAESEAALEEAQAEYDAGVVKLSNARSELSSKMAQAEEEFAAAEKKIEDGWEEYNKSSEEFKTQKAEAEAELKESEQQLTEAKYEIERIENAVWYVLDRTSTYGFASYQNTADKMQALATILPVFFILVAVLVCMTTMTRMVAEQRGLIGTYKALGYNDNAIAARFVLYVTAASVIGGVIGAVLGVKLFPSAVYNAWASMYYQPEFKQQLRVGVLIVSFVITVVAMAVTAYYTCHNELKNQPAMLMRPKAPKNGKKIFLENFKGFWKKCSFVWKVTFRNIFRYKNRMFMTIIGIMGCTAMLLAAFGMSDSIGDVVDNQYEKIYNYDITVYTDGDAEDVLTLLDGSSLVNSYRWSGSTSVTLVDDTSSESVAVEVIEDTTDINDYIRLQKRGSKDSIKLDDTGIVLTEKLAKSMGVSIGDSVRVLDTTNVEKNIPVIGITEQYIFHHAYMTQAAFESYFHYTVDQNVLLIRLNDSAKAEITDLLAEIENTDGASSVKYFGDSAESFEDQVTALNSIVILIIVCAALLAFVVLYNLININVSERVREIATIRVLGFKNGETAMYIYRESFTLTIVGALLGLALGCGLHRIIMMSIEQSDVMFGYYINPMSFVISFVLTLVFTVLVMLYMYRKIANIEMAESLKSVE